MDLSRRVSLLHDVRELVRENAIAMSSVFTRAEHDVIADRESARIERMGRTLGCGAAMDSDR